MADYFTGSDGVTRCAACGGVGFCSPFCSSTARLPEPACGTCKDTGIVPVGDGYSVNPCVCAEQPAKDEQPSEGDVGRDEARLALFRAIEAIQIGNKTDDKLILDELRKAGYWITRLQDAATTPSQEPVAWFCEHRAKCNWQGFALRHGLAWGAPENTQIAWREAHEKHCGGKFHLLYLAPPANDEAVRLLRRIADLTDNIEIDESCPEYARKEAGILDAEIRAFLTTHKQEGK